jgi:3-oxoacyl-[acyl-carrier protein] reductase
MLRTNGEPFPVRRVYLNLPCIHYAASFISRGARKSASGIFSFRSFMTSSAALRPGKGQGFYAAAKLAGESLYRSIGLELASRGVTACSLRLSWIDAGRGAAFLAGRRQKAEELMPSGRLVTARQATDALLFLLQEGSAAFNAVALDLDGGFSAVKPVC